MRNLSLEKRGLEDSLLHSFAKGKPQYFTMSSEIRKHHHHHPSHSAKSDQRDFHTTTSKGKYRHRLKRTGSTK